MNKIGRKIKDTRKRVGMTQTEVAEKMGVSYQTVAQWENGLRNPKPESVKRIADALGVGYLDLIPEDSKWAYLFDAATSLSTLQAENEKLRAELEQVKRMYEAEKEDFIDFACSGVPNLSPYCMSRHPSCVDERGWCRTEKCRGFSRERGQKED